MESWREKKTCKVESVFIAELLGSRYQADLHEHYLLRIQRSHSASALKAKVQVLATANLLIKSYAHRAAVS